MFTPFILQKACVLAFFPHVGTLLLWFSSKKARGDLRLSFGNVRVSGSLVPAKQVRLIMRIIDPCLVWCLLIPGMAFISLAALAANLAIYVAGRRLYSIKVMTERLASIWQILCFRGFPKQIYILSNKWAP